MLSRKNDVEMSLTQKLKIGLISLPLILGFYGKNEAHAQQFQQPQTKEVQIESDLESKLRIVLKNISSNLSKSEVTSGEYYQIILEQLKSQGILSRDYNIKHAYNIILTKTLINNQNAYNIGVMKVLFDEKLKTRFRFGLNATYVALESTPFSDKARKDIGAYEKLKKEVGEYLKQKIGNKPISKENYKSLVQTYVSEKLPPKFNKLPPNVNFSRKYQIIGLLESIYRPEFNIISPVEEREEKFTGNYPLRNIEKALERVK